MTIEETVAELVAVEAVKDVQLRYCRGLDRLDWDLVRTCFHPDATHDLGPFRGTVDEFLGWVPTLLPTFESTTHLSGQQRVEIRGSTAFAEQYVRACHRIPSRAGEPPNDWTINLRYIDEMHRRNGEWRIFSRLCVCDSSRTDPVTDDGALGSEWHLGARNRTDPSYRNPTA